MEGQELQSEATSIAEVTEMVRVAFDKYLRELHCIRWLDWHIDQPDRRAIAVEYMTQLWMTIFGRLFVLEPDEARVWETRDEGMNGDG